MYLQYRSLFTSFLENLARSSIMLACSHNGLNCNYGQLYNYSDLFVKVFIFLDIEILEAIFNTN